MRCFVRKKLIGLTLSTIGLIVYDGVCSQTGVVCEEAAAKAFSTKRNLGSWAAVGAVPFTMQCLSDRLEHKLGNNIARLCNKELEVRLKWKGIAMSKMGNMANKQVLYQQFAVDRGDDNLGLRQTCPMDRGHRGGSHRVERCAH